MWNTAIQRLSELSSEQTELIYSLAFLFLWTGIGTIVYSLMEDWTLLEGLYMCFITLTTIGFGEVNNLSEGGRVFTIFFAVIGLSSAAYGISRTAQILFTPHAIRRRRLLRKIRNMQDHYIICGYGRIGQRVVHDLKTSGKEVVVIDRNHEVAMRLQRKYIPYMEGDATDERVLQAAGIDDAKGLVTLLPEDATNVFVTLLARDLNKNLFILARAEVINNRKRLIQAGASQVVAPSNIGGIRMAQVILRPNVDEFLTRILKADHGELIMDEVLVEPGAFLAGKTLAKARFRQHFETIVLAVIQGETGETRFNPSPHDSINAGDILIVMGSQGMIDILVAEGCTKPVKATTPSLRPRRSA